MFNTVRMNFVGMGVCLLPQCVIPIEHNQTGEVIREAKKGDQPRRFTRPKLTKLSFVKKWRVT